MKFMQFLVQTCAEQSCVLFIDVKNIEL